MRREKAIPDSATDSARMPAHQAMASQGAFPTGVPFSRPRTLSMIGVIGWWPEKTWLAQWVSMTRPQLIPSAMAHTEWAMAILADLGLDVNERLHMAVTLANYVRGTAINLEPEAQAEQDTGITSHEWMASQDAVMTGIVASGEFPMFAELAQDEDLDLTLESLFEFGLARLLDGLEVSAGRPAATRAAEGGRPGAG